MSMSEAEKWAQSVIDLKWFHGPGQSAFERSPMGSMLDRAKTYDNADAYHQMRRDHNLKRRRMINDPYATETPMCFPDVLQFDAISTSEVRPAPSSDVDDKDLQMFARASRGLKRLGIVCPHGPEVMRGRYGEEHDAWLACGFMIGWSYAMTDSGRALIKRIRAEAANGNKAKLSLTDAELLSNDFKRAEHIKDNDRLILFGQADGEGRRLLDDVVDVWRALHREM